MARKPKTKFTVGQKAKCVSAGSYSYRTGQLYTVEEVEDELGVRGSDGIFDTFAAMVSKFEPVKETAVEKALRLWKGAPRNSKQMQEGFKNE